MTRCISFVPVNKTCEDSLRRFLQPSQDFRRLSFSLVLIEWGRGRRMH
jgi:hypothetical protein